MRLQYLHKIILELIWHHYAENAAVNAMQRDSPKISSSDFAIGLKRVRPSITKEINKWYNDITAEVSNIIPKSSGETFYQIKLTINYKNIVIDKIKESGSITDKTLVKSHNKRWLSIYQMVFLIKRCSIWK